MTSLGKAPFRMKQVKPNLKKRVKNHREAGLQRHPSGSARSAPYTECGGGL